jgi:2-hydroxy-6-oxonona-2,4-dienedioate hydrolase
MSVYAATSPTADAGIEAYRATERALWHHYGLEPTEHFVDVGSPAVRLRVLEIGSGEPVLLVHGTVGPGGWPALVRELPRFRCLVLDRPGWGLSSPLDFSRYDYKAVVADVLRGMLDALDVDRAHVVGGSIGNVWALRLAQQHPTRVGRIGLLGGSPLVPEVPVPGIIRFLASPAGTIMVGLSRKPKFVRAMLAKNGHGDSLAAGRIPDEFVDWRVALARATDSMREERAMVRAIVNGRAFRPGLTFTDAEFRAVEHSTLLVYGTADPVGSVDLWRRAVDLLPHGRLEVVGRAGHMPWLDDPVWVGTAVDRFLTD